MKLLNHVLKGYDIVAFAISEDMSTSANVMRLAAQELNAEDKIKVIDSANLSTGIGHQVVEAAIMAQHGKNADEIVSYIEQIKPKEQALWLILLYISTGVEDVADLQQWQVVC